jgi:TP901 family phage tail tape measure protein
MANDFNVRVGVTAEMDKAKVQSEINKQSKDVKLKIEADLELDKNILNNRINTFLKQNTKLGEDFKNQLKGIQSQIANVDKSQLKNLSKEFRQVSTEAASVGKIGKNVFDQLKTNIGQFLNFFYGAGSVVAVIGTFRNIVTEVTEVNKSMIALRKVTEESDAAYEKFLDTAAQKAKTLGASISNVVNMTAEWAKAGYNLEQSAQLSAVSTIFSNVGDVDAETAVKDIVTALKSFRLEANDAISVVDKLNEVDNNFAVSSADVGTGLANAASALALAGNDINQSIALITGGSEITQNASETGNAIKVLSMRLRGMKGELEAIGEEYENIDSVSKIQTQIYNLSKGKVNIMDDLDPTKFKSTYEIMKQISKVWNEISQTDQAQLLEIVAGKQRGNQIAAIISSFQSGQIDKALETSITSQNSALNEQQKFMEGIEYSVNRLKASLQELSTTTLDSSVIKLFVDMANGAVNATTSVGGLVPVLSTLAVLYLSFTKSEKFSFLQDFAKKVLVLSSNAKTASMSVETLAASSKALSFAMGTGLMLAVTAITMAVTKYSQSIEEAKKRSKELTQQYDDEQKTLSEQLIKYKELEEKLKDSNLSVSENKSIKEQLLTIQDTLVEKFGLEADAIDIVNGKYDDQIEKLNILSKQKANEYVALNEEGYRNAKQTVEGRGTYSLTGDYGNQMSDELVNYLSTYKGLNVEKITQGILGSGAKVSVSDVTKEGLFNALTSLYNDLGNDLESSQEISDFQSKISKMLTSIDMQEINSAKSTVEAYTKAQVISNDTLRPLYERTKQAIDDYNYALENGNGVKEAKYNLETIKSEISDNVNLIDGSETVFASLFDSITTGTQTTDNALNNEEQSILSLSEALETLSKNSKLIESVKNEFKELGTVSTDTLNDIISIYPELENVIKDYISGAINKDDLLAELNNAYQTDYDNYIFAVLGKKATDKEFYDDVLDKLPNWVSEQADAYGIDLSNFSNLQTAKLELAKQYHEKLALLNKAQDILSSGSFTAGFNSDYTGSTQSLIDQMQSNFIEKLRGDADTISSIINGIDTSLNIKGYTPSKVDADTTDKAKKAAEEAEKARQKAIQDVKDKFSKEDDTNKFLLDTGKIDESEYYKRLQALNKKYFEGKKDFLAEDRQNQVAYYKWDKEQLEKSVKDKLQAISDSTDRILSLYDKSQSQMKDIGDSYTDGSDEQIEAYSKGLSNVSKEIAYINGQIKKLNDMRAKGDFKGNEDEYTSQLKTLQDALADTTSSYKTFTDAMADSVKSQQDDIADHFEKRQEKIIKSLEDERKAYDDIIDAQKELIDLKEKQRDYEKSIAKQTKEISQIENRMAELQLAANTGDRQAEAELRKLDEERAEKKDALNEDIHDNEIDLQKTALDKAKDDYDKLHESKMTALEEEHKKQIDDINDIYNNMIITIKNSANMLDSEFGTKIQGYLSQLNNFGIVPSDEFVNGLKGGQAQNNKKEQALSILQGANGQGKGSSELNSYVTKDLKFNQLSYENMAQLASVFGFGGVTAENIKTDTLTKNMLLEELKRLFSNSTFATGGITKVNKSSSSGLLSDLLKSIGEDKLVAVRDQEGIMTKDETKVFKYDFIPTMNKFMTAFKPTLPDMSNIVTNNNSTPIQIANLLSINGNVDSAVVNRLETSTNQLAKQFAKAVMDVKRTK